MIAATIRGLEEVPLPLVARYEAVAGKNVDALIGAVKPPSITNSAPVQQALSAEIVLITPTARRSRGY